MFCIPADRPTVEISLRCKLPISLLFGTMHLAQTNHFPSDVEPYFPTIPAFWETWCRNIQADGGVYDLEALHKLLPKVRAKERMPTKQELRGGQAKSKP